MFHTLAYSVTFPTGRRLSADLEFIPGFCAITGSNESGKSLVLEMLRFSLFGSQALRGVAADYADLTCASSFTIKDQRYSIIRTMRRAELKRGDEIIASGVSVVNTKIVQLLGFGLHVFDTACSINQGEVERLGNMSPAERKRLVDSVLGIEVLDIVSRWGMEEARLLEREAEALTRSLRAPVEPVMPEPYRPGIDIDKHRAEARELAEIEGWLAHPRARPVEPTCDVTESSVELAILAQDRAELREKVATLAARVKGLPESAPYDEVQLKRAADQWARYDQYLQAQAWLKAHPNPEHELETCHSYLAEYAALDAAEAAMRNREALERELRQAKEKGACTGCGLPFAHDHIAELEAALDAIEITPVAFDPRRYSRASLERALRAWDGFDDAMYQRMKAVAPVEAPTIKRELIPTYAQQLVLTAEREALLPELSDLMVQLQEMPDYEGMLVRRKAYEAALERYAKEVVDYRVWESEREAKLDRRDQLWGLDPDAERDYLAARDYDNAFARFQEEQAAYDAGVLEIERLTAEVARYRKVRDLMNVLRSLIKQHLMPSLNRVASHLLNGMTGGQRTSIYVNEEFEITVDGQRLETLSGSGKACANLALRIALGQVLTNKVISVLLADEIDASMDDFRAQQTSNVLGIIQNSISQVLLVSHKSIEADNRIHLGGFIESDAGGTA